MGSPAFSGATGSATAGTVPRAPRSASPDEPLTRDERELLDRVRAARTAAELLRRPGHGITVLAKLAIGFNGSVDVDVLIREGKGGDW